MNIKNNLSSPEVTLIIPVYNEEHNILLLINEIEKKVTCSFIAYIIYDSKEDSTLKKANEIQKKFNRYIFIQNKFELNVIGAFKTGFDIAKTKYVVPIMADLSDTPETVDKLLLKINQGYDLVIASRYMKGGKKIGGSKLKKVLSKGMNITLSKITKLSVHDITNAFIIYRKEALNNVEITSTGGFEITMEIIAKAFENNWLITEIPTINRDRLHGQSNFKLIEWAKNYLYWFFYIIRIDISKRLVKTKKIFSFRSN